MVMFGCSSTCFTAPKSVSVLKLCDATMIASSAIRATPKKNTLPYAVDML